MASSSPCRDHLHTPSFYQATLHKYDPTEEKRWGELLSNPLYADALKKMKGVYAQLKPSGKDSVSPEKNSLCEGDSLIAQAEKVQKLFKNPRGGDDNNLIMELADLCLKFSTGGVFTACRGGVCNKDLLKKVQAAFSSLIRTIPEDVGREIITRYVQSECKGGRTRIAHERFTNLSFLRSKTLAPSFDKIQLIGEVAKEGDVLSKDSWDIYLNTAINRTFAVLVKLPENDPVWGEFGTIIPLQINKVTNQELKSDLGIKYKALFEPRNQKNEEIFEDCKRQITALPLITEEAANLVAQIEVILKDADKKFLQINNDLSSSPIKQNAALKEWADRIKKTVVDLKELKELPPNSPIRLKFLNWPLCGHKPLDRACTEIIQNHLEATFNAIRASVTQKLTDSG